MTGISWHDESLQNSLDIHRYCGEYVKEDNSILNCDVQLVEVPPVKQAFLLTPAPPKRGKLGAADGQIPLLGGAGVGASFIKLHIALY